MVVISYIEYHSFCLARQWSGDLEAICWVLIIRPGLVDLQEDRHLAFQRLGTHLIGV